MEGHDLHRLADENAIPVQLYHGLSCVPESVLDSRMGERYCVSRPTSTDASQVTQEIVLARNLVVTLGSQLLRLPDLIRLLDTFADEWRYAAFNDFVGIEEMTRDAPLLSLMTHFRNKRCGILHDRVFSLLALSHGGHRLQVDYNLQHIDLALRVLELDPERLCTCSIAKVMKTLHVRLGDMENVWTSAHRKRPWLAVHLQGLMLRQWHLAFSLQYHDGVGPGQEVSYFTNGPVPRCPWQWLRHIFLLLISSDHLIHGGPTGTVSRPSNDEPIPLAKAYNDFQWFQGQWLHDSSVPGVSMAVVDEEANECIIRIELSVLERDKKGHGKTCAFSRPWYDPAYQGPIKSIRLAYDSE